MTVCMGVLVYIYSQGKGDDFDYGGDGILFFSFNQLQIKLIVDKTSLLPLLK